MLLLLSAKLNARVHIVIRQCLVMTTVLVECGIANGSHISFPISYLNISMMITRMNSKNLETDYIMNHASGS